MVSDTLCIDCRGCAQIPDVKSPDCIRCMVHNISQYGNAERIRMRTGRDLEISGVATELLCDLAFVDRSSQVVGRSENNRSCSNCDYSCEKIFDLAWQGFPDPYFEAARGRLLEFRPVERECATCIQKTYRALDQSELGLNNIKKRVSVLAIRGGGV